MRRAFAPVAGQHGVLPGGYGDSTSRSAGSAVMPLTIVAAILLSVLMSAEAVAQDASRLTPVGIQLEGRNESLSDLIDALEHRNPELEAQRRAVDASLAAIRPAGALPDPSVSAGYMSGLRAFPYVPTTNPTDSFRQVGASQEFPFPGKRGLRTGMAVAESEGQKWVEEGTRRRLVAELKGAYFEYVFVERSLEILARNKGRLDEFRQIADARYSVGRTMQQDVLKAQLEISLLLERQAMLQRQRSSLAAQINGLLYRNTGSALSLATDYTRSNRLPNLDELQTLAARNDPDLKRDERMIDRGQQALALSRRERLPDFAVNAELQQMVGGMPWMYGIDVMVKVPLYWQRKQQPLIAQSAAQLEQAKRTRENTLARAGAQVVDLYAMADTSRRLTLLYEDSVLPQARLTLESSLASYQVGGVDFLTVLTNLITVLSYEVSFEEQTARFHQALAQLEPLVGIALTN